MSFLDLKAGYASLHLELTGQPYIPPQRVHKIEVVDRDQSLAVALNDSIPDHSAPPAQPNEELARINALIATMENPLAAG